MIVFPPFTLDPGNEQLFRGGEALGLRPKAFAVLRYLAERPGQLVTKEELLTAVWPETFITDTVLKVCVNELRKVLADGATRPRIIQTVHRRGYRFIAPTRPDVGHGESTLPPPARRPVGRIVGREVEREQLRAALARSRGGERHVVLVSGEAGMGKTALVQSFLADAAAAPDPPTIAVGQCVAHYGSGEPFLPLLEALDRLCRGSEGARILDVLRRRAPEWLMQLPGLISSDERAELKRQTDPAAPDRMLRVGVAFLEALAADRPVILVLEDMQWSDHSTVDVLSRLAERTDPARLFVLATYRPAEAIVRSHPLRAVAQELQTRRRCTEIALGFLGEDATEAYLQARFPGAPLPSGLVAWLRQRTDGNPLFMVNVVDELAMQGLVIEENGRAVPCAGFERIGVPESLRQMIEQQIDRLAAEDQGVVDAAAVAGAEFSAAAVAAALDANVVDVEARLRAWAQRGQLVRDGGLAVWPDGTVAAQLAFAHSLYREVQYQRIAPARRAQLHRRIGERLETAYAGQDPPAPAELAMHFEQCGELDKAIAYLRRSARQARRRGAHHEVVACLGDAIGLLGRQAATPERARDLVALHLRCGTSLVATKGPAHPDVKHAYTEARTHADAIGDAASSFLARIGIWGVHFLRADHGGEGETSEAFLQLAHEAFPPFVSLAHAMVGTDALYRGDFVDGSAQLDRALATDAEAPSGIRPDPRGISLTSSALVLCLLGRPDDARRRDVEARGQVEALRDPFDQALPLMLSAQLAMLLRDVAGATRIAERAELLLREQESSLATLSRFVRAWCRAASGEPAALAIMERSLDELRARDVRRGRPTCLAVLAEQLLGHGRVRDALACLDVALATIDATGERLYEAEVHRLRGECWRALAASGRRRRPSAPGAGASVASATNDPLAEAERSFAYALDVARRQQARWWELRAATSLAALLLDQSRGDEAHRLLAPLHANFGEGDDARDLVDAKALLDRTKGT